MRSPAPRVVGLALTAVVAVVAFLVLVPDDDLPSSAVWRLSVTLRDAGLPGWLSSYDLWEFLANIALFAPLGALAAALRPGWPLWAWTGVALLVSGSVEAVQAVFLPGRTASRADVLANCLGWLVGVVLFLAARRAVAGSGRTQLPRRS